MFCSKCGKEINASIAFCPYCGQPTGLSAAQPVVSEPIKTEQIETAVQPIYIPENNYAPVVPVAAPKKKRLGLILGITIPAVILVLAIIIGAVLSMGGGLFGPSKADLQKQLLRDWSRVETGSGSTYTLRLDFTSDEIKYIFDGSYIDRTIATYDYEVVDGDTIKVEGFGNVEVEFNDEKTMMIFTPSITDSESKEYWYNFD